jgi:hypothetical protein
MYLTDVCIRNLGPIVSCDIQPTFNSNGSPKPIVLVGLNGAGKTFVLSAIADAMILMSSSVFTDVAKEQSGKRPYFRVCGGTNQRSGSPYALSLLAFSDGDKVAEYIERTGTLNDEAERGLIGRFPALTGQSNSSESVYKSITGFSNDEIERLFLSNAYCFFPASRHEVAHWQNLEAFPRKDSFESGPRFRGRLGRDIIASSTGSENSRWIVDVVLDSRIDVSFNNGALQTVQDGAALQNHLLFGQARKNIEQVLQNVLQKPEARIKVAYRGQGPRLQIDLGDGTVIPSLSHLSLGQSLLFNLFCTIVRHADAGDLNKGHQLEEIRGIAVIDEAEVHLHETLRHEVLPELIGLFPKVQFILATHSPSLLLGLKNHMGDDSFDTFDLPSGTRISIDRFSEFEKSIQHLKASAAFESALLECYANGQKPIVLTEGETDPEYIKSALKILGRSDLLTAIDIDWVGGIDDRGNAYNTGDSALNAIAKFLAANPVLLTRKMLLLYDCDTKKPDENILENLWSRSLPANSANTVLNKGIENLLSPDAVCETDYDEHTKERDYGGSTIVRELNKRRFCNRICGLKDASYFTGFSAVIEIFDAFLDSVGAAQPEMASTGLESTGLGD